MVASTRPFEAESQSALLELRAALADLFVAAKADPAQPQRVARDFGLNKTLTWSVTRLLRETDPVVAMGYVPGVGSIERLASALGARDGATAAAQRVTTAARAFEAMVRSHVGDRWTLELVNDGQSERDTLAASRRYAFRGNSGLYGVQARTRSAAWLVWPGPTGNRLVLATVSGYIGFRRLRASVRWPLFTSRYWAASESDWKGRKPMFGEGRAGFVPGFEPSEPSRVQHVSSPEAETVMLEPGEIGNVGSMDCFRAEWEEDAAPRFFTPRDPTGEVGVSITTPSENLLLDVFIHRELGYERTLRALVFGRMYSHGQSTGTEEDPALLPIKPRIDMRSCESVGLRTTLIPRYGELIGRVAARAGLDMLDFVLARIEMDYPPLHSTILARFDLPPAPPKRAP